MEKYLGITEPCWNALPEDKRIAWKYFSRTVAIIGAFFVEKSGNSYVDWTIGAFAAIFLMIIIETQRSYSKLSPCFRKRSVRAAIVLGSWGVVVLGMALFLQVGLASAAYVLSNDVLPVLADNTADTGFKVLFLIAFIIAVPITFIHIFRELRLWELIYHLPRNGLIQLLVYKEPKARSFAQFAYMEFSVLLVCLVYASSVASIVKTFMNILQEVAV